MSNKASLSNRIIDRQTKREIYSSSLTQFSLAGWEEFQDGLYTPDNKLSLLEGVSQKITFNTPLISPKFDRRPVVGKQTFPIWDFENNKILSYEENKDCCCSIRLQLTAEPVTNATGVALALSLVIPNVTTFYIDTKPLLRGNIAQSIDFTVPFYFDQATIENGIELYVESIGDDVDIYNQRIFIRNW